MYYFSDRDSMIHAIAKPGMKICEVGVFLGQFAQVLASTLPEELVLIDPWDGECISGNQDGNNVVKANLSEAYPLIQKHFSRWDWVKVRRGLSQNILPLYPDNYFDMIYIDGLHSYEGCTADLDLAYKKVKPGGWICGHDYGLNENKCKTAYCFGVVRATDEFCERYKQKIVLLATDGCVSYGINLQKPAANS
jgi:hypothetical protein